MCHSGLYTITSFSFPSLLLPDLGNSHCSFCGPSLHSVILGKTIILHSVNKFLLSTVIESGYTVVHKKDTSWSSQSTSAFQNPIIPASLRACQPSNTIPGTSHILCILTAFLLFFNQFSRGRSYTSMRKYTNFQCKIWLVWQIESCVANTAIKIIEISSLKPFPQALSQSIICLYSGPWQSLICFLCLSFLFLGFYIHSIIQYIIFLYLAFYINTTCNVSEIYPCWCMTQ